MAQQVALEEPAPLDDVAGAPAGSDPSEASAPAPSWPRRVLRGHGVGAAAVLAGLVLTVALASVTTVVGQRTEQRLLSTQVRQGAAVLQLDANAILHPLAAASEAAVTDPASFRQYAAADVGKGQPYRSLSLWRRTGGRYAPVVVVGAPLSVTPATPGVQHLFRRSGAARALGVLGELSRPRPEVLYAFVAVAGNGNLAVLAEHALRPGRRIRPVPGSAFSDLDFAIYLGQRAVPGRLVETTAAHLPLPGPTATVVVPFGDTSLTLVAASVGWLNGTLSEWLPLELALAGTLLALAAGLLVDRLVGRRRQAEQLAAEVSRLYGEQRTIAESLQRALLPDAPPAVPGLDLALRYAAGTGASEVGGDWYDVVPFGEDEVLAVVGDVSGRGVEAARVMASLRYALRAYAAEGGRLVDLVAKLSGLLDVQADGHFATLLAVAVHVGRRRLRVVNAGHLPPLLVDGEARYLDAPVSPPIGVGRGPYAETEVTVGPGATLLAYTDGLVERRSAGVDPGLRQLRATASAHEGPLEALVGTVLSELAPDGDDDTAILALRWRP